MPLSAQLTNLLKFSDAIPRSYEYAQNTESEAPYETPAAPKNWPTNGRIEVRNYTTRYRENLPLVLKKLSFTVNAKEKVGIVGRTGCGKSSLILALTRLLEPMSAAIRKNEFDLKKLDEENAKLCDEKSEIWIDGVNVLDIGLKHLRKNLCVVPQDPCILEGTLRKCVDPFGDFSDAEIVAALKKSQVWDTLAPPKPSDENGQQKDIEST